MSVKAKNCLWVLICWLVASVSDAQNLSNRGTEFLVGYGHHQFMEPTVDITTNSDGVSLQNKQEMVLYFSAEEAATVTVSINGTTWQRTYNVPANSVIASDYMPKDGRDDCRLYSLPPGYGGTGGEGVFNRGIRIKSSVPIVAYAHIFGMVSSGATMLMPVETWGYEYVSVNSRQRYKYDCFSWAYVVADHDNTVVDITPSVLTRNGHQAGITFSVTLNKGQIYQVIGANPGNKEDALEVSGTRFKSVANGNGECFPIAVFSGSSRTLNEMPGCSLPAWSWGSGGGDNDNQQLFPTRAWGKRYVTAPTSAFSDPRFTAFNSYKILVKDPATVVKRNGATLSGLTNSYYYFESDKPELIEADKPIMVAQFMTGGTSCSGDGSNVGDPEMIYISPIEQGIKRIGFFRNNRENIIANYLTLVVPNGGTGLSSLLIDGQPLSAVPAGSVHIYQHPRVPRYTVVVRKWTGFTNNPAFPPGQCIVQSDSAFTAVTYGLGGYESYGYNAGTLINNLGAIGSVRNVLDEKHDTHLFTCVNTPAELSALMSYQPEKMVWKLSALNGDIEPAQDVTIASPVPVATVMVNDIPYYKYTLPGTFRFLKAGEIRVPILSTHPDVENCTHTEELKIAVTVKEKPLADFSFTHSGCALDTVYLKAVATTVDGYTLSDYKWLFPGNIAATGMDTVHVFAPGADQQVQLSSVTSEGCVADTVKLITVHDKPVGDFSYSTAAPCKDGSFSFSPSATDYFNQTAIDGWYWDFGNGKTAAASGTHQAVYEQAGEYKVKYVVKAGELCISDTLEKTIKVYPNPEIVISYPEGCLPVDGMVRFQNKTTAGEGQQLSVHSWSFGDHAATPANPDHSAEKEPSHQYSSYGKYAIGYKVVTDKGCSSDTLINASFYLSPILSFAALEGVCEELDAFSIAKANVTNAIMGTGQYKGIATTGSGIFTPGDAGAGTHVIKYVFTAQSGCKDSIEQAIEVYPRPESSYSFNNNSCLGEKTVLTNTSVVSSGSIRLWSWDLDNGTKMDKTNGAPLELIYAAAGDYNVTLKTQSDKGCISEPYAQKVSVHPLPVAAFDVPAAICMPGGAAAFINKSTNPGTGTLTYAWVLGDGIGTSAEKDPSYRYTAAGTYTVRLTATSVYGCKHTVSHNVDKFFNRPVAAFSPDAEELCEGGNSVFTDQSNALGSSVSAWKWDFGDGTSSTVQSPVKKYERSGEYAVSLEVSNAVGCLSETISTNVKVYPQPVINAGPSFTVVAGTLVTFEASANEGNYRFLWSPAARLSDATVLRPSVQVNGDEVYTLTATGEFNCTATASLSVKLLRKVDPPNAFTPNGDGVHDRWEIPYLSDYADAVVQVFNRYGQLVFRTVGYGAAWDGTKDGKPLPSGTYYYVIRLKNDMPSLKGSVTILR